MSVRFSWLTRLLWLIAIFAGLYSGRAEACEIRLSPVATTVELPYDPFTFVPTAGQLVVEAENRATDACDAELVLLQSSRTPAGEVDIDATGIVATVSGSGSSLMPTSASGTWRVRLQPSSRVKLVLDVQVTRDAVASAGEHSADLTVELREAGSVAASAQPLPCRLVLIAPPRAQMNIAGAAATFGQGASVARIDFGVLEGTVTRRVFLQVRSNTRARLTIDSANLGRLLPLKNVAGEAGISYTAQLSEEAVDLTKHWEQIVVPQPTLAGSSLPFDLSVTTPGAHMEGTYSDQLTLELSAL